MLLDGQKNGKGIYPKLVTAHKLLAEKLSFYTFSDFIGLYFTIH